MAITRTQQPNRWSAVYNPIIYKFQSTFGTRGRIGSAVVVDSIGESNGLLQVIFTTNHGFAAGDYVDFADGDAPGYYRVTDVPNATTAIFNITLDAIGALTNVYLAAFQYNASIRVLDSSDNEIATLTQKAFESAGVLTFIFDVASILKTVISMDLPDLTDNDFQSCPNSFKKYRIQYREEYMKGVAGVTTYYQQDWQSDYENTTYYDYNWKWAVNACEQYDQQMGDTYKQSEFVMDGITPAYFLTNQPDTTPFTSGNKYPVYFNHEYMNTGDFQLKIEQYNGDTLLSTTTISNGTAWDEGQHCILISEALFTLNAATTNISVYSVVDSVESYPIEWRVSEACTQYEYRMAWLNDKGGVSTTEFTGKADQIIDVERSAQVLFNLQPGNFRPPYRQLGNIRNTATKSLVLRNETSNLEVHNWLATELMTSVEVYLISTIDGTDYFIPVVVDTNTLNKYKDGSKRYNIALAVKYGYQLVGQEL